MFFKTKLDTAIVCLLVLSSLALIAFHALPRTQTLSVQNQHWCAESVGNATKIGPCLTDEAFELDINPSLASEDPFAMMWIKPISNSEGTESIEEGAQNLEWVEQVSIETKIEGDQRAKFRLQFRGYNPKYYAENDDTSLKYNEVVFCATREWKTIDFDRGSFSVPGWWADSHAADPSDTSTDFQNIKWIEVATGSQLSDTPIKLLVRKIKLSGYWINPIVFYRCLLGSWIVFGITVFLGKFYKQGVNLREASKEKQQLASLNKSLRMMADEYSSLAKVDSLTGLANRRGMQQSVSEMLHIDSNNSHHALILFDVDNFKQFNDKHGHLAGDEALKDLGRVCSELSSENFAIARWGGEEFLACYSGDFPDQALKNAEMLRESIKSHAGVTCSFGVHVLSEQDDFSDAMTKADCALYQAKRAGKDRIQVYESDFSTSQPELHYSDC